MRWIRSEHLHHDFQGAGAIIAMAAPPDAWLTSWPSLPDLSSVQLVYIDETGRPAAISTNAGDQHLQDLSEAMLEARLGTNQRQRILIRAWETAVEGALEDGLAKYASHFNLTQEDLDGNGTQTSLVQAAVIRDVTQGLVPQRQTITGAVPFNLMKSETLVWVIQDVDYLETVVRRERRGYSHGLSIRVARGVYYRPSTFRSRPNRVGGNHPCRYRTPGPHHQAHLLRSGLWCLPAPPSDARAGCRGDFPFKLFEVDHKVPHSRGGTDHLENLQLLCSSCNRIKGDRPQEYLVARLAEIGV